MNKIQFQDKLSFDLKENSDYGTRIGKVVAHDPDEAENSEVTFHLLNSTDSKYFFLGKMNF